MNNFKRTERENFKHSSRYFGRGEIQFALLELLLEKAMHGYQLMKELEAKSEGLYIPSPGSIYPTLQMLEDQDYVTISENEGKKIYYITEAGKQYLHEKVSQLTLNSSCAKPFTFFQHQLKENYLHVGKQELINLIEKAEAVAATDLQKKGQLQRFYQRASSRLRSFLEDRQGE